jgi:uncharacterized sporulation protein YeaH/YhbH (DUF444 family)
MGEKADNHSKRRSARQAPPAEHGGPGSHELPPSGDAGDFASGVKRLYDWHDLFTLQAMSSPRTGPTVQLKSIDELLERDAQREKDGFPRKIRVGRLIKPGKGGKDKVVVVPTTVEEKLLHDRSYLEEEEDGGMGGSGEGEEGEVIGEQPIREEEAGAGSGPGQGEGGSHEIESSAYDLGRILTEQFQLPNLKDKGKKRSLTRYTYDLTDRHQGFGQLLDKKATLRKILETNITLGNVPDVTDVDTTRFLVSPKDKIYRVLSREKDYESQAMVFFIRDYSGSMGGKPTELIVTQHVLIYSWLLYQYARQVETRFILHDTEAREVDDFYTYYNLKVAGGTQVFSAYRLVNEIVETENLARDYNIFVFQGTDGDDWDSDGEKSLPELEKILGYASRVGITVAEHPASAEKKTEVERYLVKSDLLERSPKLIRLDVMGQDADEARLIEGIRKLISE